MLNRKERVLNDYAKEGLRDDVKVLVNEEIARSKLWFITIVIFGLAILVSLALYVGYVTKDVQETNDLKREVIRKELETDSLKREKFKEFDKKYDESLKEYYRQLWKKNNGTR